MLGRQGDTVSENRPYGTASRDAPTGQPRGRLYGTALRHGFTGRRYGTASLRHGFKG